MVVCWCVLLCVLSCWGQCEALGAECVCKCKEDRPLCVDLRMLGNLLSNTSAGRSTSHDRRILLCQVSFDKIRHSEFHGCVLTTILKFYLKVLEQEVQHTDLAHFLNRMIHCVRKNKAVCRPLQKQAKSLPVNQTRQETELQPRELALLQIHRLDTVKLQLSDRAVQDKAMVELEGLQSYVRGTGFRKYQYQHSKTIHQQ